MTMRKTKKKSTPVWVSEAQPQPPEARAEGGCVVVESQKGREDETLVLAVPPIPDGFYEIETIRRKRVRKGEVQYLIKWRGWPETANTWEPLHNLQSVPDLIHAFEDSLKSGIHRKRRRNQQHHALPNNSLTHQPCTTFRHFPPQTLSSPDEGETDGDPTCLGNSSVNTSKHIAHGNQENGDDPMLGELKPIKNNGGEADNLAIHFQQAKISTGNDHTDAQPKVDCTEPVQSGRCRGAKRRKSGSVKRFKKETCARESVDTHNAMGISVGTVEPGWTENCGYMGNNSHNEIADAKTACNIVKIIKPIGCYSASLSCNTQDVLVTFMAIRSDGTEVMVDNKYLKAYNPLLLINFYEQHLRYSPTY